MYKFCSQISRIEYKDKIVLINMTNGNWIRLFKSVYEIIEWAVNSEISSEQLMEALADKDDQEYIYEVIENLLKIELLNEKNKVIQNNKTVIFEITNRCNLHCIHCCNNSDNIFDFELSYEEITQILKLLIGEQPTNIILSGGEPLIRDDFIDIISFLRSNYRGKVSLMTNGTLINYNNVDSIIFNIDEINISVDGVNEETTKVIRGKNVFNKVIFAVNLLHKKGFQNITLSMVNNSNNYQLEEEFFDLNRKLKTKPLIRGFAEVGRGALNSKFFSGDSENTYLYNVFSEENLKKENTKKLSPCTCMAGKEKILIDYKGNVFPCQWFKEPEFRLDNLLSNHSEKFHYTKNISKFEEFYPWNIDKCCNCEVNYFCWPCPGELKTKVNKKVELEKICKIMKPILFKSVWDEEIS